jgi:hypothetical protein
MQADLFSPPLKELSRTGDPETSKEAVRRLKESGELAIQEQRILTLCKTYPGADFTFKELAGRAEAIGVPLSGTQINKRLVYLRRKSLIEKTGEVREGCAVYRVVK